MTATESRTGLREVPGDGGYPLIGYSWQFVSGAFATDRTRFDKYGPVSWMSALGKYWVNGAGTGRLWRGAAEPQQRLRREPGWGFLIGPFFRRGLMLLDGAEHHAHRRIMQEAFTSERLAGYLDPMNDTVAKGIDRWPADGHVRFYPTIKQLTLDVATETFMGAQTGSEADRLNRPSSTRARRHRGRPLPGTRAAVEARACRAAGAGGLPASAHRRQARGRRHRPVQRAVPRPQRGRRELHRRRHRQPHDLPADGRARHGDDHDDVDGLLPRDAPRVAGPLPGGVAGAGKDVPATTTRPVRRSTW